MVARLGKINYTVLLNIAFTEMCQQLTVDMMDMVIEFDILPEEMPII